MSISAAGRAFGKTDRVGVARPVPENDAARIWRELERQRRQKTLLSARFQFPAAGAVVIFPLENICCPRKRAVSNFQVTLDVQLTGQRVGCVVAATWPEGLQKQPVDEYVSGEAEQLVRVRH